MTDEELREAAPTLPVLYFDGFGYFRKFNGVLRCVAYTIGVGPRYNLITSLAGAYVANREVRRTLDESSTSIRIWNGSSLAH